VELNEVRNYNNGIDGEYVERFYFYFDLVLNDADVSAPVTAKLQYADIGSENWTDCPSLGESVLTSQFNGGDTHWSCEEIMFDVFDLEIREPIGLMKRARIAVDYTLTNGNTGTVYTTDLDELFIYKGEFIREVSVSFDGTTIVANYRIDTDLVLDISKLTLRELTVIRIRPDISYDYWNIENEAVITPFAADGSFTVTYNTGDIELLPDDLCYIGIGYDYFDHEGFIEWNSYCSMSFDAPAPFVSPTVTNTSAEESDGGGYSYIPFTVSVGDGTEYGQLTAYLERWNGSDYELFSEGSGPSTVNTLSLAQGDPSDEWTTAPSGDCFIADLAEENGFGFFRVALRYIDDAGAEQTAYGEPLAVCKGSFVTPVEDESFSVGDGYFYAGFFADPELVDLSKVETVEFTAQTLSGEDILLELEWFTLDPSTGEVSVRGQVNEPLAGSDGRFVAAVKLRYNDADAGPVSVEWTCVSSIEIGLDIPEWGYPASFVSVEVVPDPSDNPSFQFTFVVSMNDAESVTAKLYYVEGINGWDIEECDPEFGTVVLTHDNIADPVAYWSTSAYVDCLSYTVSLPDGLPGTFCWFSIELESTMPGGEVSYEYSRDMAAFCGTFFETQYYYGNYNPIEQSFNCRWLIYPELAPNIEELSVNSIKLVPQSGLFPTIVIPNESLSFTEGTDGDPHMAYLSLDELELSSETDWLIELTMTCGNEQFTWTRTSSSPIQISVKHSNQPVYHHYPILSHMRPIGGKYYEEKE
jgi:hypothetical protein